MRLRAVADFVLDLLFPKRCPWCGAVVGFAPGCACEKEREAIAQAARSITDFTLEPWNLADVYAVYAYEYPARNAVLRFKFEGERQLAAELGAAMVWRFFQCGLGSQFDVMVPAPVSAKTLKKRGYNQSALLARVVAEKTGLACDETLLQKVKETAAQRTLDRADRIANVKDAYRADKAVQGKRVLIIDDIVTTGSTLNECAAALLQAGAACCGALCLAATGHTGDDSADRPKEL